MSGDKMKNWKIYWDGSVWKLKEDIGLFTMWVGTDQDLLDLQIALKKTIDENLNWPIKKSNK